MSTEPLSEVLGECLEAVERGELTLDECLARHPEQRDELAGLLMAAQQLRDAPPVRPSPDFQHAARARLANRLAPRPAPGRLPVWAGWLSSWRRRVQPQAALRWAAAAVLVIAFLAGGTAAYASTGAVPGDGLYPLKRTIEQVRLAVALSTADRLDLHLQYAERRLWEAEALRQLGRMEALGQARDDYEAEREWLAQNLAGLTPDQAGPFAKTLSAHEARYQALFSSAAAEMTEVVMLTATLTRTATPSPSPTRTPTPTATPTPSASRTRTAVAYPTYLETPIATYIVGPVATRAAEFTPAGRFCWPSNVPTPEQWPVNWPTPDPNCPPIPIPTQICWPPGVPTPDPSRWPVGVPTPDPSCWPTRPSVPTGLPTQWPTAWPSQWPTPDGTPGPQATPWWRTPDPSRLPPSTPDWPTPDPSRLPESTRVWPTAWPTIDLTERPRRP